MGILMQVGIRLNAELKGWNYDFSDLFNMINAPITPGTHAHTVSRKTMMIEPQPLS